MESKIEKWIEYCNENNIRMINIESEIYYCAIDIGLKIELKEIRTSIRSFDDSKKKTLFVKTKVGNRKTSFLSFLGCIELLIKSRSILSQESLFCIGIHKIESIKIVSIESKTIRFIKRCFRDEEMIQQFCVGSYRIDLYFPKYKIAVECDEKSNHTSFKQLQKDQERQDFIESELGCTFIRYRPEENEMELADAIYRIQEIIKHKRL